MTKLLKLFLMAAAFAGFFAVAFLGFQIAMKSGGGAMEAPPSKASASSEGSAPRALSSIVQDYEHGDELAKAGPADAATTSNPALAAAGGAKAVHTPPPTMKVIREWNTGRKLIALTFDDGPHPTITPQLIELLKTKNARATFFLIGPNVEKHAEIAKQIADAGFEMGNHSWTHPSLNRIPPEKAKEELTKTSDAIRQATGVDAQVMRPPFGTTNKKVEEICDGLGLRIINWSVDTNDWAKTAKAATMEENIMKNARDGSIILMHDRYERTLEVTASVIDQLRAKGYEFVTVSELLGVRPVGSAPKPAAPQPAAAAPAAVPEPAAVAPTPGESLPAPATRPPAAEDPQDAPGQTIATQVLPAVSGEKITRLPHRQAR